MTLCLGNVPAGTTLYIPFATYGSLGQSLTMTGLAVGDILIYKAGSVTQRDSTDGFTLLDTDGIDFDGITGIHGISIDLSDNDDDGFYTVGSWYWVVISSVTVNSQTVNFVAAVFRIVAAENTTGYPNGDVEYLEGSLASTTIGSAVDGSLEDYDPPTATEMASAFATTDGLIGTAQADLDIITGASGVVLADDSITAAKIAANAIGASELAADAATEIATAVWASGTRTVTAATNITSTDAAVPITAGGLVSADVTGISTSTTAADNLESCFTGTITTLDDLPTAEDISTEVWSESERLLTGPDNLTSTDEVIPIDGLGLVDVDKAGIADSVLDELLAGHTDAGSLSKGISDILVDTGTTLDGKLDTAQTDLDTLTGTDGALLDSATTDVYHADIEITVDEVNSLDEYTITWFKNGVRVSSGITSPTIQVVKRADGTDLIAETAMTEIGSTGSYKYNATSSRVTAGEAVLAVVSATIDSGTRTFSRLLGRDSSA